MVKVAQIGLGYFSQFHLAAWQAHPKVTALAATDLDPQRRLWAREMGVKVHAEAVSLLQPLAPDIVDIVAPPPAHRALLEQALAPGRLVICQKPFCTSLREAKEMAHLAEARGASLIIHENFRFQPWHRTLKAELTEGRIGRPYQARFALRPGDGRGADAYLARQPGFQRMERFLIHETGVHFIDLFRWLFGEIDTVYADLRRLNPHIAGEDAGQMILSHQGGVQSTFDGNRLSDHPTDNPRRTMGEMLIEGEGGTLRLDGAGAIWHRPFGARAEVAVPLRHPVDEASFGGGCVAALIEAAVESYLAGAHLMNPAKDYLEVMRVVEAAYLSAREGRRIAL